MSIPLNLVVLPGGTILKSTTDSGEEVQHVIVDSGGGSSGLTDTELRATPVPVSGTVSTGGLTNAELRASSVPVSGPLTDTQLRAVAVPVSVTSLPLPAGASTEVTLALIKAKTDNLDVALSTRAVTGLTDAQLRATPVPVSGTVTANLGTIAGVSTEATLALIKAKTDNLDVALSTRAITGLTDAQLRATPVAVTGTVTETNASIGVNAATAPTSSTQVGGIDGSGNLQAASVIATAPAGTEEAFVTRNIPSGTQAVSVSSLPLPAGAATEATLALIKAKTDNLDVALSTRAVTGLTDTQLRASAVPVSAASLPLPSGAATEATLALIKAKTDNLDVALSTRAVTGLTDIQLRATAVPISAASLPLPSGASQEHTTAASPNSSRLSDGAAFYDATKTGQLPSALVGGRLDENIGAWLGSTAPTVGQKVMASSVPVTLASDQPGIAPQSVTAGDAIGVIVTNAATLIAAANAGRKGLTMVNSGSFGVHISHDPAVTTTGVKMGLYLAPKGGSFTDDKVDTRAWYGKATGAVAAENISYLERT